MQLSVVAAFRASGNTLSAMAIALVSQFLLQFPLAYLLSSHTSLEAAGIWWSFPITSAIMTVFSAVWLATGRWSAKRLTEEDKQIVAVTDEAIAEEGVR